MKVLKSQYFVCGSQGYYKLKDPEIKEHSVKKQLSVSSRCNQILPIKESKIQEDIQQETVHKNKQLNQMADQQRQNLNLNQTISMLKNPLTSKIMEKDEVHSIHIDDNKSLNNKVFNSARDLTYSTFTNLQKPRDQMKRSLNFHQNSTAPSLQQNQNSDKLNQFYSQLISQKNYRKELQEKYNILINLVETNIKMKTQISQIQEDKLSQNHQKNKLRQSRNKKRKKYQVYNKKIQTEESQQTENQNLIILGARNCRTSRNKNKALDQIGCRSYKQLKNEQYYTQNQEQIQELKQKMNLFADHIQSLEQRLQESERKFQLELLQRDLKQKERQIQIMQNENTRMKEFNDLMVMRQIKSDRKQHQCILEKTTGKNTILMSLLFNLVILLVCSNLKNLMC